MTINVRSEVENILNRKLTSAEVEYYSIFWTHAVMNSFDLAARIKEGN